MYAVERKTTVDGQLDAFFSAVKIDLSAPAQTHTHIHTRTHARTHARTHTEQYIHQQLPRVYSPYLGPNFKGRK